MRALIQIVLLVALTLATAGRHGNAEEPRTALDALLSELVGLFDGGDALALGKRLRASRADPWILCQLLAARDRVDVAKACAEAMAPDPDAPLRKHLAGQTDWPREPIERVLGVQPLLRSGEPDALLARLEAEVPPDRPLLHAARLLFRGVVLRRKEQGPAALSELRNAAVGARDIGWIQGVLTAAAHGAQLARAQGDMLANLEFTQLRLDAFTRAGSQVRAAAALGDLANARAQLGDYVGAASLYESSLERLKSLGQSKRFARTLRNYGLALKLQGNYAGALHALSEAVEVGGSEPWLHDVRSLLGSVQTELGDVDAAIPVLEAAVQGLRATGSKRRLAHALANLTWAYGIAGDLELAQATYADARERLTKLNLQPLVGLLDSDRAIWLARHGKADDALRAQRGALAAARQANDHQTEIQALDHIAALLVEQGAWAEARASSEELITTLEAMHRSDGLVSALERMARIEAQEGNRTRALEQCVTAVEHMERVLEGLDEVSAAFLRERRARSIATGLRLAYELKQPGPFVAILERGRAALQDRSAADTAGVRAGIDPALQKAERDARVRAALAKKQLMTLRAKDAGRKQTRPAHVALVEAQQALRDVLRRVQRESRAGRALYPPADDLATIQGALRADEVLVLYSLVGETAYAAVVDTKQARLTSLGPTAKLEAICDEMAFSRKGWDPSAVSTALEARVIDALELPGGTTRLILAVDGALAFVPFQALLPDREVTYVPSGTAYRLLRERSAISGTKVLAVGDPDYKAAAKQAHQLPGAIRVNRGDEQEVTRGELQALPATEAEAKAVGDVVLIEGEATEARVRAALAERRAAKERWKAVHFACHGFADTEHPIFSSLALTPDGSDDGFLHAHEILAMGIDADLAVLSACNTARGRYFRAFGVRGLARSFLDAGANGVIVSLWKVPDAPTGELMKRFHALWNPRDGKTKPLSAAQALKAAQAHVRSQPEWKHPRNWAAWQLWGLGD